MRAYLVDKHYTRNDLCYALVDVPLEQPCLPSRASVSVNVHFVDNAK